MKQADERTTECARVFAVVGVLVYGGVRTAAFLCVLATQSALVVADARLCTYKAYANVLVQELIRR